eukprot:scaffold104843_cov31-Tisochrysis_lutea.AAC.3
MCSKHTAEKAAVICGWQVRGHRRRSREGGQHTMWNDAICVPCRRESCPSGGGDGRARGRSVGFARRPVDAMVSIAKGVGSSIYARRRSEGGMGCLNG